MKSPTDVFEDAEIAREERHRTLTANELAEVVKQLQQGIDDTLQTDAFDSSGLPQFERDYLSGAKKAIELLRQSPASTTAADAWDEGYERAESDSDTGFWTKRLRPNPYRVAAPEGDGGNE